MKYNWRNLYMSMFLGAALATASHSLTHGAGSVATITSPSNKTEAVDKSHKTHSKKHDADSVTRERIAKHIAERKSYRPLPSRSGYHIGVRRSNISAYTLLECGKYNGITASGKTVKKGRTIAASRAVPFGTEFYIPEFDPRNPLFKNQPSEVQNYLAKNGYTGFFVVEDRGGAIKGNKIDVYFGEGRKALHYANRFGRKNLKAYIIN